MAGTKSERSNEWNGGEAEFGDKLRGKKRD
jgi:hypothetical protein